MKHFTALLMAALLCLSLAGCKKPAAPDPAPAPEPEPSAPVETVEPTRLEVLHVECTTDGQSVDDLMTLQQLTLPEAMARGLEAQNIALARTHVTFGTSAEATVQALLSGAIDLAFLPADVFLAHEEELRFLAVEQGEEKDLSRSIACAAASGDDALADALRAVTDGLSLPHYADGVYVSDASLLDSLRRAMTDEPAEPDPADVDPTEDHVLATGKAAVKGYEPLTLELIGKRTEDGELMGVCRIDVYDANYLIQSIELTDIISRDGVNGIERGYTECPDEDLLFSIGDVSFDGSDDLALYGWRAASGAPYYYFLWDTDEMRFEYGFCLMNVELDAAAQHLLSTTRVNAATYQTDTYGYVDGTLTLLSSETFGPEIDARKAAMAYYEGTVFTVEDMQVTEADERVFVFSVTVSKGGEVQEVARTITLEQTDGVWTVTGEGY